MRRWSRGHISRDTEDPASVGRSAATRRDRPDRGEVPAPRRAPSLTCQHTGSPTADFTLRIGSTTLRGSFPVVETTVQMTAGPGDVTAPAKRIVLHRLLRVPLMVLAGIAGAIVAVAILTALAHPAGADPLPPVLSASGGAISSPVVVPVPVPVASSVATIRAISAAAPSMIDSVPAVLPTAVRTLSASTASLVRDSTLHTPILVQSLPTADPAHGLRTSPVLVPPSAPLRTHTTDTVVAGSGLSYPGDQTQKADWGHGMPLPRQTPAPPLPAPTVPIPLPNPSPTAGDAGGAFAAGQGSSPLGSMSPSSRLLPSLAFTAVSAGHGKTPRLLLDARCSPPG